ncbi:MAG: hypothetical protein Ct9H300mP2_3910 [Candidatus Neomarinimicrobiota bacterium]|nr:MAG: hypothetical protein Ct9H300mP2_3910 [Candidatus Neomarinimicrobiota bacterium]
MNGVIDPFIIDYKFFHEIDGWYTLGNKFNKPRFRYDITVFNNWLFLIRWPTRVTGFYETLVKYQEERNNFPRIERYGLEISQQVNLDERSFFGNNAVWEYFSDQKDSLQKISTKINFYAISF